MGLIQLKLHKMKFNYGSKTKKFFNGNKFHKNGSMNFEHKTFIAGKI